MPVLLAIAFGLWVSWRYATDGLGGDPDISHPAMLWEGVRDHGLSFLSSFNFTPDNWLIWPLPLFFGAFALFGVTPGVVLTMGWLIFVSCAFMAALVVRRVAGPGASLATAVILLLSNRSAIGAVGLFAYPLTHNASLLAGLSALYACLRWLETLRPTWLGAAGFCLTAAGASDPWLQAAVTLPLGLGGAWLAWNDRARDSRPGAALAVMAGAAFIAVGTRLFGLLHFVPQQPVQLASRDWGLRAAYLLKLLGSLFNVLPGQDRPYLEGLSAVAVTIDVIVLFGVAMAAAVWLLPRLGRSPSRDLLWITGAASAAVTAAAFILLPFGMAPVMGRYFLATYVFGVVIVASGVDAAWAALKPGGRTLALAAAVALPVSGLASGWPLWIRAPQPPPPSGALALAQALQDRGLTYGYGQYWDAQANAVTWLTRRRVTIRPVGFDPATGRVVPRQAEASPFWFKASDRPTGSGSVFLMIGARNAADSDGCVTRALCAAAAVRQFGPPAREFTLGESLVLVWNHSLFEATPAERAASAAEVALGVPISMTGVGAARHLLGDGWADSEPIGTWTQAPKAYLLIHLPKSESALRLTLDVGAFAPPPLSGQVVSIRAVGRTLAEWTVARGEPRPYTAVVPADLARTGSLVLEISIPNALSPAKAKVSADTRRLGINLKDLRVDPAS